jgi:ribosomal small subunit protein bTHX
MGRGDKKTKKGKRFLGSFGVSRKSKVKKEIPAPKPKAVKPVKEQPVTEEKPKAAPKPKAASKAKAEPKAKAEKTNAEKKPAATKKEPAAKKAAAPKAKKKSEEA